MDDINSKLQSIAEKTRKLIKENQDLKNYIKEMSSSNEIINQLENKINILNNQLSEEKKKQESNEQTVQMLLREIDECLNIYSNEQ